MSLIPKRSGLRQKIAWVRVTEALSLIQAALATSGAASSDFDLNPDVQLPANRKLRMAGVLVPILCRADGAQLYLTKRSSALKHHPGQIAFPGGKQDQDDADITATALREASEEIGLAAENVQVLGQMAPHETVTGFVVTPIVAQVIEPFVPTPEAGEVAEVFTVPMRHVLDSAQYSVQYRRWRGARRHYYTVPFGPYYIWGATARILRSLSDAVERV